MVNSGQDNSRAPKILIYAITAVIILAAAFLFLLTGISFNSERAGRVNGEGPSAESPDLRKMTDRDIEEAQKAAARAAITGKPVAGRVTQRPEYVSEIEWQVLRNAVMNRPEDADAQLAALVNKLLFFKKKEAWESPATLPEQRRKLARQMLSMLPFMTGGDHINPGEARRLESSLNAELTLVD
ncbi:MAG TPA: hypothetical protein PLM53_09815 [Spirochaetota bacterium]|nr:hypothetical protein [Spirochaetota bacterium]HPL19005.1 hypothetical protein [Spirochaetota bacterium]HQF08669.1 hypothetical protein [Spirochaetota bacterium]HQH97384.1 hypothetical protein [Spirochaetota bacterium]HRS77139.1 hypothetical protein [Spirochaetota bacterium]